MFANQNSSLIAQMELVKSLMKLTPEERRKEVRRRMFEELRAVEMERRERAMEKLKMEREEREQVEEMVRRQREKSLEEREIQEAKQREEEERKGHELKALQKAEVDQLKQERLRWCDKNGMQVEEEEPGKRQEEAELHHPQRVSDRASRGCLTSDLKSPKHQEKKKTLINNWVGEPKTESKAFREKPKPDNSNFLLFSVKESPQSEEKPDKQTPKPKEPKQWLPDRLKVQYWMGRYQDHKEKKDEKRKQKAEDQYARWAAIKASRAGHASRQNDSYTGGFSANRNSILKSLF
ncbi:vicilin-like seed storage protein At2g18540 [Notolabrus celidotus]|uniref:vicilin-like seed storage protein At2g18540 n=1 Tax=Notolabrus celidotus TaxID=1203425 RepID=UPI00148FFCCF|nr:vicilin-like seed storage protein At2g18540 [Notolabrus celidotus]